MSDDDKIRCTFEDCYLRFDTVEAMKKHKARATDQIHEFYCKKCDEDCEDDIAYLIHQIQSRKHIACPVCGAEFKSEGGRDRHVGINHRRKQEIKCPGCSVMFESASALMGHVEGNKCKTITRDDFHKHRAERDIEREALEEIMGVEFQNSTAIDTIGSQPDSLHGGISLLDNERVVLEPDWQDHSQYDPRTADGSRPETQANQISKQMLNLAINQYPPLTAARGKGDTQSQYVTDHITRGDSSDLWNVEEEPEVWPRKPNTLIGNHNVWGNNNNNNNVWNNARSNASQRPQSPSSNLLDTASSVNLLESTVSKNTAATRGTHRSTTTWDTSNTNPLPPSARPENLDPNHPHTHIQTAPPKRPVPSRLDLHRYWDPIQSCYICPSFKCGQRIPHIAAFEDHLRSGVHVVERVECPSCLKKFKTTTALVAHAESGSVKCDLRNSAEYDLALRNITAGMIRVDGTWRDGSVKYESVPVSQW